MHKILEVKNLQIDLNTQENGERIVNDVDFNLYRGQVLGLVGESGCGKSVTCLSLTGLLSDPFQVVQGEVNFAGENLLELSREKIENIRGKSLAMIMQNPMAAFNPMVTVGRHFIETLQAHWDISKKAAKMMAIEQLRSMELPNCEDLMNQYPFELSGGMLQRVMIAIAIAENPAVLLADEPTTALDTTVQYQILGEIAKLQERCQCAVLWITHDLNLIAQMADEVAVMYCGRIVEKGPVEMLFDHPLHPYTQGLLESRPGLDGTQLKPLEGQIPSLHIQGKAGCSFFLRCPYREAECRSYDMKPIQKTDHHVVRCLKFM